MRPARLNEPRFADVPPARIVPVCWRTKREGLVGGGIDYRLQLSHLKLCASRPFWLVTYPSQGHEMLFDAFNGKPQAFTEC